MERIRRRLDNKFAFAAAVGRIPPLGYDPKKSWGVAWRAAFQDTDYWRTEFEEPAMMIKIRAVPMMSALSGEAPVDGGTVARVARPSRGSREELSADRPAKIHKVSDGSYTHNRRGAMLCGDFQTGQCTSSSSDAHCSRSPDLMHQCAKCLSVAHGAHHPTECGHKPSEPTAVEFGRRPKGKGKGKNKSAKGKSKWY